MEEIGRASGAVSDERFLLSLLINWEKSFVGVSPFRAFSDADINPE